MSSPKTPNFPMADHPRLLLHNFLSPHLCKELEFIHRSCGAVGYRPGVLSTTLAHLVATKCGHLIIPFVPIREKIKEKAEEAFGCHFELFVEFTGLISWCKGSCIGWHSDDNRPYLKQRDFAAVCYLNSHGIDFNGGVFHFKDGEPSSIVPLAGDLLIYTADSRNIHSVDEVIDGERLTLTLWFTRDSAHDEDVKLINLLSQELSNYDDHKPESYLPLPASDNMYWFHHGNLGFDIRCGRMQMLGYHFCSSIDGKCDTSETLDDLLDLLNKPLRICRGDEIYEKEFVNSLHALQVVQFYYWKSPELSAARRDINHQETTKLSLLQEATDSRLVLPSTYQVAITVLGRLSYDDAEISFDWDEINLAVQRWEDYVSSLHKDLLTLMPCWVTNQAISLMNHSELEDCNQALE